MDSPAIEFGCCLWQAWDTAVTLEMHRVSQWSHVRQAGEHWNRFRGKPTTVLHFRCFPLALSREKKR